MYGVCIANCGVIAIIFILYNIIALKYFQNGQEKNNNKNGKENKKRFFINWLMWFALRRNFSIIIMMDAALRKWIGNIFFFLFFFCFVHFTFSTSSNSSLPFGARINSVVNGKINPNGRERIPFFFFRFGTVYIYVIFSRQHGYVSLNCGSSFQTMNEIKKKITKIQINGNYWFYSNETMNYKRIITNICYSIASNISNENNFNYYRQWKNVAFSFNRIRFFIFLFSIYNFAIFYLKCVFIAKSIVVFSKHERDGNSINERPKLIVVNWLDSGSFQLCMYVCVRCVALIDMGNVACVTWFYANKSKIINS